MATSHYCDGKWRDGPVASCPKHTKMSRKQTAVVANPEHRGGVDSPPPSDGSSDSD